MSTTITGGVCAALGFRAAGLHVGVKTHAAWKKDVALIVSDVPCRAAAMFTKNVVKAAPIHVTKAHLAHGQVRAVIANSGNANACAPQGEENAERMCAAAAKAIGCAGEEVLVASTGVIGQTLKYRDFYAGARFVTVRPDDAPACGFIGSSNLAGTNDLQIFVCGNGEQAMLCARLDNLGKGASGAAVQNMNLMLGLPEETGLTG